MAAEPADLYVEVEESARDDDVDVDGRSRVPVPVPSPSGWELPPCPVLRNVFRRPPPPPRNPDFDGATFLSKPWLELPCDGPMGSFYAACYDGMVLRVSIPPPGRASPPRVDKFADAPRRESIRWARWWLAVDTASSSAGGGALVLVATERRWWKQKMYMCAFRWDDELRFWRRPKDLGGRAVFVGRGNARHLPWCAGNCIYFTRDERVRTGDDVPVRCCDVRRQKLYSVHNAGPKVAMAPPVWVMPFHE
uniref:KIB1-4 beta-propeller domain-containing protein n=1 Tax=Oryza barthii TaxID=65489 RepID=A0A0D3GN18_9ORYZ